MQIFKSTQISRIKMANLSKKKIHIIQIMQIIAICLNLNKSWALSTNRLNVCDLNESQSLCIPPRKCISIKIFIITPANLQRICKLIVFSWYQNETISLMIYIPFVSWRRRFVQSLTSSTLKTFDRQIWLRD